MANRSFSPSPGKITVKEPAFNVPECKLNSNNLKVKKVVNFANVANVVIVKVTHFNQQAFIGAVSLKDAKHQIF
jgi:hypothetical protein